jgi:pantoate--beta-alanine ligase
MQKIDNLNPNIILYAPTVEEKEKLLNHFDFDGLENQMEGKFRPGHFDGVNIETPLNY